MCSLEIGEGTPAGVVASETAASTVTLSSAISSGVHSAVVTFAVKSNFAACYRMKIARRVQHQQKLRLATAQRGAKIKTLLAQESKCRMPQTAS